MGNKAKAKQTMQAAGVPVVPGGNGILEGAEDALEKLMIWVIQSC